MTDIAKIGFRADTNDLTKATGELNKMGSAAVKAENAVENLNNTQTKTSTSARAAAEGVNVQTNSLKNLKTAAIAAGDATSKVVKMSGRGGNNTSFVTGNLAAQFQDIGVTAAMGMNPLQIALQQGTQLSAILNTMESPMKGLAAAFKQVMNATSLLTIGFIGLLAAGLQLVDWTSVFKSVLNSLATAIEITTPYILGLAAALTLIYSRTIIVGITSITWSIITMGVAATSAGLQMTAAWVASLGPMSLIALAISSIIAGFILFADNSKKAINQVIGSFVGAFNIITSKSNWGKLPSVFGDLFIQMSNNALEQLNNLINSGINKINHFASMFGKSDLLSNITFEPFENKFKDSASKMSVTMSEEMSKAMNQDYVGDIENGISKVAMKIRKFASGIGMGDDEKFGKIRKNPWEEFTKGADRRIATLKAEAAAIGMNSEQVVFLRTQTEMLNEAQQKGINLTPKQIQYIEDQSRAVASLTEANRKNNEMLQLGKDVTRGFFQDLRQGLAQGQSAWEAFGNAVNNVLNKIVDKLLNELVDAMFTTSGVTSANKQGALTSVIASLFSAKGNVFDGNVKKFANGGAFTNTVVNKPTLFQFANGGAIGEMGEAGPEAILPLKRGTDGSLGVQMFGNNSGGNITPIEVNVNIVNNTGSQVKTQTTRNGNNMDIMVMIDEIGAQKIMTPGSKMNQALMAQQNKQIIKR